MIQMLKLMLVFHLMVSSSVSDLRGQEDSISGPIADGLASPSPRFARLSQGESELTAVPFVRLSQGESEVMAGRFVRFCEGESEVMAGRFVRFCQGESGARAVASQSDDAKESRDGDWIQLFNGKDLTGWTPKIRFSPLGENYGETFRVEDGLLKVVYDKEPYPKFNARFGHLFYKTPYSHYRLRAEYRFVGEQCPGGAGWAVRNNGLMLHCQDPKSMDKDQEFPVSIEAQLLGGDGSQERSTLNLCTPGTNVVLGGELFLPHCTNSTSKTYHGDQWVTVEVEVHGAKTIRHIMEDKVVLEYSQPQLDPRDKHAQALIQRRGGELLLSDGYIAIQAESSPIEFRKIELQILPH